MDDELVECPVCHVFASASEIEQHVQQHFEDVAPSSRQSIPDFEHEGIQCSTCGAVVALDDLDSHEEAHRLQEMEAQQKCKEQQHEAQEFEQLQMKFGFTDKRPGKCHRCGEKGHWARECPTNPAAAAARFKQLLTTVPSQLVRVQQLDAAAANSIDIIPLLQVCLEAQPKAHSTVYLSGPVGFYSGRGMEDCGWGCGYRNIQMQASHLLMQGGPCKDSVFGGSGFVPNISSLQAWLEVAWKAGFDPGGAAMFAGQVQGTRKWIGTTEAAALLRYFGCRALIEEFYGRTPAPADNACDASVHEGVACDVCGQQPIVGSRHKSYQTPNYDVCSKCRRSPAAQRHAPFMSLGQHAPNGQHQLLDSWEVGSNAYPNSSAAKATAGCATASEGGSNQPQQQTVQLNSNPQDQRWHRKQQHCQQASNDDAICTNCRPGQQNSLAKAKQEGQQRQQQQGRHSETIGKQSDSSRQSNSASTADSERHRALAEWIWNYFVQGAGEPSSDNNAATAAAVCKGCSSCNTIHSAVAGTAAANGASGTGCSGSSNGMKGMKLPKLHSPVTVTYKPPLYLQHEGHSRTVVGIERCLPPNKRAQGGGATAEYNLLILDPGIAVAELLDALRQQKQWQKLVKRGLHSLARKAEFQVLHIAPGLVPVGPQRDALKLVKAENRY